MGLKLVILGWWTPKYVIRRELSDVSDQTTATLESLLVKYAHETSSNPRKPLQSKDITKQRTEMAETHARLVEALEAALGREEAVKIGREALFSVGKSLGKEARRKLGVGESREDLIRAAKILYRVLGIDFQFELHNSKDATIIVDECALSKKYSELTCKVLSATDEGVIKGLQPSCSMNFTEFMTSGCSKCRASIIFNKESAK